MKGGLNENGVSRARVNLLGSETNDFTYNTCRLVRARKERIGDNLSWEVEYKEKEGLA